jgi:hypothetical protein
MDAGGSALTTISPDSALVRPLDEKSSVCVPGPVMVRLLKVAVEPAPVLTLVVPDRAPGPLPRVT